MKDIDGNKVNIGDKVKVLCIRDNIRAILADDEIEPTLSMLGCNYEINDFVNNNSQVSVSYQLGCQWIGLYLFPNEFRLVKTSNNQSHL